MRARLLDLGEVTETEVQRWQHLAGRASEPNPFFEPGAVLPARGLLPDAGDVRLLLVEDGQDAVLLLPLVSRRSYGRVPVPALATWQHAYAYVGAPLLDPDPDRAREAWRAALDRLADDRAAWLALERLPTAGPAAAALQDVLRARGTRTRVLDRFARPVLLRRPEADYLDGRISGRHLKALRRQRRRLEERLGPVALHDRTDDPAALERLLQVELAGWKGAAGTAIASRPEDRDYVVRLADGFRRAGRLQVWWWGSAEVPAALQLNLLAGDSVFHVKIAHDEAYSAFSPGLQTELEMVREFHADRRLARLDSCVDPGNRVSTQLYPDRQELGTLLVPLGGRAAWPGRVAVAAAPHVAAAVRQARRARASWAAVRAGRLAA